ncbi:hypothetical protein [Escherichia coli]|uniref:hypothetical protein n=1 Tax=Escherichia coli TaxID=562 RepID=UPI00289EF43A|nr:hypothetical protein [Escherichia coli]
MAIPNFSNNVGAPAKIAASILNESPDKLSIFSSTAISSTVKTINGVCSSSIIVDFIPIDFLLKLLAMDSSDCLSLPILMAVVFKVFFYIIKLTYARYNIYKALIISLLCFGFFPSSRRHLFSLMNLCVVIVSSSR